MTEIMEYVRNGPEEGGDRLSRRVMGFYLHWRTWALIGVLLAGLVVAAYLTTNMGKGAWLYVFFVGVLTNGVANWVSES